MNPSDLPPHHARRDGTEIVAGRHRPGSHVRIGRRCPRAPWWRQRRTWLVAGAVVLALAALSAVRYYLAASALSDGRAQIQAARQLMTGDLTHLNSSRVAQAEADLQRAADDFGGKSRLVSDGWLAQAASHLPWLSTQINGAVALRSAGAAGAQLGLDIVHLLRDVVPGAVRPASSSPLQRLAALAASHPQELTKAAADVVVFERTLSAVPTQPLFGPLEHARLSVVQEGGKLAATVGPAVQILQAIPAAIGPGTHSYLLLLENPGEERPSGGYIGAVGEVTFTDGAIGALSFRDSAYYTPLVRNIPPPPALSQYLYGNHPWELDDANWSADFPTAMGQVERFYTAATGKTVDGVISIDPVALGYVLAVTGPARVPPYPQVVTSDNVLKELNYITNKARPVDPGKVFLPPFGELMTRRLLQAPVGEMSRLAAALQHGAQEKHIALYFHDRALQTLVDGAGFGGRLTTPTSDSILVDDANISGTKGDLFVSRHMSLSVTVDSNGNATDRLNLVYSNPRLTTPADRALLPFSGGQYRNYLRMYLPETAAVSSMTASLNGARPSTVAPESIAFEFGQEAVSYYFIVPVGGTVQISLTYSGPFADISVSPEQYSLAWVKQVNALSWPVALSVTMPNGKTVRWSATLATDRRWSTTG